jgi:hypothetical protein
MATTKHGNHAFTGVFLVGLGTVALFDYWWPGIMFVIAVSVLVRALVEGKLAENLLSVAILTGIGIIGVLGHLHLGEKIKLWPVLFIVIGLAYLAKTFWKRT